MKKFWYILIILIIIASIIGFGYYFFNSNQNNISNSEQNTYDNSYDASRTTTYNSQNTTANQTTSNNENKSNDDAKDDKQNTTEKNDISKNTTSSEKQISSYTTTIYTKESDRQNNISIACSALNGTTVKNGDTFSFTSTVGKTTFSKGYEKADVYVDGDVTQALGGGICQVSSTLYNAVRSVSKLDVTERHEHSNNVPYVPKGRDAAVAYGSYDFKFVNNTGNTIKIKASNTKSKVTVKIYEIT